MYRMLSRTAGCRCLDWGCVPRGVARRDSGPQGRSLAASVRYASGNVESGVSAQDGSFPTEAKVVIGGGGVIGCSVAYHLAKAGLKDILLLEQGR